MQRRSFLGLLGGAGLGWPRAIDALAGQVASGGAPEDEAFWRFVRGRFSLPSGRIYLNNGTLGPAPRVVMDATLEHERRVAATYPPGVDWTVLKAAVGDLLGGDPDGFVFPRNTTEAMSFVAHGLDLGPGDEILTTDHEHIGGASAWELVAARRGATLRRVSLPVPATSLDQLQEVVLGAVGASTRVVMVSHVTFTTGTALPVTDLARELAARGIVFVVDGAHPPGMLQISLRSLGGDFYASSPHKWLLAPQGTGLLYLSPSWRERLWPTLASGGWEDTSLGAHRLNHLGTFDESRLAGLLAAVEFHRTLGADRVEGRVRYLQSRLVELLAEIPGVSLASPTERALTSGMVSFAVEGVDGLALQRYLARAANVRTRVIGEYGYGWMRLSTHLYNLPSELEVVADLLDGVARRGLPSGGTPFDQSRTTGT